VIDVLIMTAAASPFKSRTPTAQSRNGRTSPWPASTTPPRTQRIHQRVRDLPWLQGQLVERRSKQQLRTMSVEWLAITDRSTTNVDFGVVPTGIEPVTFRV
jgi:hypothetical protein